MLLRLLIFGTRGKRACRRRSLGMLMLVVYLFREGWVFGRGSFEIGRRFRVRGMGSWRIWSWDGGLAERC